MENFMKYIMVSLVLLFNIGSATAENWQLLADAEKNRLIVDLESVNIDLYDEDKLRVYGSFQLLNPKLGDSFFIGAIDVKECITKRAGSIIYVLDKDNSITNFWSSQGTKLTDYSGTFLCQCAIKYLSEKNKYNSKHIYM
jgi:hypothetical protein